jgi:hypothetical protein
MAITINIEIGGKEKIFVAPSPKARLIRRSIEIQEIGKSGLTAKDLDALVDFITEIFGHKFTVDDVYDGVDANKLMSEMMRVIEEMTSGLSADPNAKAAK